MTNASRKNIELNPNMQYILAGDISASMQTIDEKCANTSRYAYMLEKFKQFISEAQQFDPDGVTVMLFGENVHTYYNTTPEKVVGYLDRPNFEGYTMTHLAIAKAWEIHREEKKKLKLADKTHPGTVLFIFTDGQPTAEEAVEDLITQIANSVDREDEFNIGFLLVGTIPPNLRDFLDKLDNGLKNAKHDIVGTHEVEGLSFLAAVNNAVNE